MKNHHVLSVIWDYVLITLGSIIFCLAWTSFLIPNGLASGGMTGLCTIIQYGTGIPVGITYPIVNVLLLILAFFSLGKSFGFKTVYVIVFTSILFEVLPRFPQLEVLNIPDKLLVALVGAIMESVGIGIVLLKGGSTGGTDIIAMIINKYWPISPGKVYLYSDIFIIALLLFVPGMGVVDMIYAYVVMITFSFGVDFVLLGNKSSVQILVFSSKYKEIADHIINDVHRGVTALQSVGWYSQMNEVVSEIKEIDRNAFISISTANSVYGEGFEELKTGIDIKKLKKTEASNEQESCN